MDARPGAQLPLFDMDDPAFVDSAGPADDPVEGAPAPGALPAWAGRIGVFDLETTGVDVERDRIVSAHVGLLDADGVVLEAHRWLADPGIEIPAGAAAVHGITTARARAEGRPAAVVVAEVVAAVRALLEAGVPVTAYNAPFDFSLLRHEAERHGVAPILDPAPVLDPLVLDKTFDRYRKGKRTLDLVAQHYDVPLDDAHDASADAVAAGRVALALADRFAPDLPPTLEDLHALQVAWAREQADGLTAYFVRIGRLSPGDELDGSWPIR